MSVSLLGQRLLPLVRCLRETRRSAASTAVGSSEPGFESFLFDAQRSSDETPRDWDAYGVQEDEESYDRLSEAARYGKAHIGLVIAPSELQEAVLERLRGADRKAVHAEAQEMWARQRQAAIAPPWVRASRQKGQPTRRTDTGSHGYTEQAAMAYALGLMPQAYAATKHVLAETARRLGGQTGDVPPWEPDRLVDWGSGTASVAWAATEAWPNLQTYIGLESARHMVSMGETLLESLPVQLDARIVQAGITAQDGRRAARATPDEARKTVAVSAFALSEVGSAEARSQLVANMWKSAEVIVLIERGTPAGFLMIAEARRQLLDLGRRSPSDGSTPIETIVVDGQTYTAVSKAGAADGPMIGSHVVAPCPHDGECPLHRQKDFCHFTQKRAWVDVRWN